MKSIILNSLILFLMINLFSCGYSQSKSYNYQIIPQGKTAKFDKNFMQIEILSSIALGNKQIKSMPISELSGITWDNDEQLLYAVSDEGLLYHFKLGFSNNPSKKIQSIEAVFSTPLKDSIGYPLKGKYSDSEGLSLKNGNNGKKGDSVLIVSFENKPRISQYNPTGKLLKNIKIPKYLHKRKTYRSKNKALESVTLHPKYGVITAAEYPIKKDDIKYQSLYAVTKKGNKRIWHFKASDATNSAVTGLEILADGSVLVLERAYQNPITPIIINLRKLKIDKCNESLECETEMLASFNGADGWLLDNFEGLAHLHGNQYLMVSDDNENPLQKTLFVHFEIKDTPKTVNK